jgi:uncharacterized protein (DUF934 family)
MTSSEQQSTKIVADGPSHGRQSILRRCVRWKPRCRAVGDYFDEREHHRNRALKGEDQDQCQQQTNDRGMIEFHDE